MRTYNQLTEAEKKEARAHARASLIGRLTDYMLDNNRDSTPTFLKPVIDAFDRAAEFHAQQQNYANANDQSSEPIKLPQAPATP